MVYNFIPHSFMINFKQLDVFFNSVGIDFRNPFYKKQEKGFLKYQYESSRKELTKVDSSHFFFNQDKSVSLYNISFDTIKVKNKKKTTITIDNNPLSYYVPYSNFALKQAMVKYETIVLDKIVKNENNLAVLRTLSNRYDHFSEMFRKYHSLGIPSSKETELFTNYVKYCSEPPRSEDSVGEFVKPVPQYTMRMQELKHFDTAKPESSNTYLELL